MKAGRHNLSPGSSDQIELSIHEISFLDVLWFGIFQSRECDSMRKHDQEGNNKNKMWLTAFFSLSMYVISQKSFKNSIKDGIEKA